VLIHPWEYLWRISILQSTYASKVESLCIAFITYSNAHYAVSLLWTEMHLKSSIRLTLRPFHSRPISEFSHLKANLPLLHYLFVDTQVRLSLMNAVSALFVVLQDFFPDFIACIRFASLLHITYSTSLAKD